MNLYYIPFDIEEALLVAKNTNQYTVDDIVKFHTLVVASTMDKYKSDKGILSNAEQIERLQPIIGNYAATIDDSNFSQRYKDTDIELKNVFWDMVNQYKVYKRISPEVFSKFLNENEIAEFIFEYKEIVDCFDEQYLEFIKANIFIIQMMLADAFEKNNNKQHRVYPKSLTPKIKVELAQKYIDAEEHNPNYLKLIVTAKPTKEFPISDQMRLAAKRKSEEYWENNKTTSITYGYGVAVAFVERPNYDYSLIREKRNIELEFSKEWVADNLDYPTLLNNFIYLLGYVDSKFRSEFVSLKHEASTLEMVMGTHSKTDYSTNSAFMSKHMIFSSEMLAYEQELLLNGVEIENIFKWFFETYLPLEFNADGFCYQQGADKKLYSEKCILLACAIDSVLKQFNLYCLNHSIDRELLEISSKPLLFSDVPSFIEKKYVVAASSDIDRECNLLYSDQSAMTYVLENKKKYHNLIGLLMGEHIKISDYKQFQASEIEWLIERGTLVTDEQGFLHPNRTRAGILKELFDKEVLCYSYANDAEQKLIDELIGRKEVHCESSLFSKPEQDYLDYMLNNSKFGNGPALRNSYVHGTYPLDPEKNRRDYYEFLKIMVLVIIKINEEFCLQDKAT